MFINYFHAYKHGFMLPYRHIILFIHLSAEPLASLIKISFTHLHCLALSKAAIERRKYFSQKYPRIL